MPLHVPQEKPKQSLNGHGGQERDSLWPPPELNTQRPQSAHHAPNLHKSVTEFLRLFVWPALHTNVGCTASRVELRAMCERFWSLLKLFAIRRFLLCGRIDFGDTGALFGWHTISGIYDLLKWINLSISRAYFLGSWLNARHFNDVWPQIVLAFA